ncbi:MAG: reverse transcriptase domain-containing protein [Candidatus Woesearchaeota archaeon]
MPTPPPPDTTFYDQICSCKNLELAFQRARKHKTTKKYVIEFEADLKENLAQLRNELLLQTYKPKPLETFILRDPKTRKISKSDFRDRIIHHAICNIIEPTFDKTFIDDSYANRIKKGTLNAIKRFDKFKKKASQNNTIRCYVLKADVKSYFDSVDHQVLLNILARKIDDKRVLWLIELILSNHKAKQENKGMPLGNLTSQFFANVYLNELDQFAKHELKAKYYIRYVDDFVILHQSRKQLEDYKEKIDNFLADTLKLKLHPDKSHIIKLEKGINFLGFRIFFHHHLLVKRNMRKFEKKLNSMKQEYTNGKITREQVIEKFEGWLAYSGHANTYKYRRKVTSKFNNLFPVEEDIKVTSVKKHENFNHKVDSSKIEFTQQKTLQLFKKGMPIKQIASHRGVKEGTIWKHVASLIEHHQLRLKQVLPNEKIKKILANIKTPNDTLKEIKERLQDETITYNEIECVLANTKGKQRKKSTNYWFSWYQRTNCHRKCNNDKTQRESCRIKFQQIVAKTASLEFSKKEFLNFFNDHVNICILPNAEKRRFVSWKEFKDKKHEKGSHKHEKPPRKTSE